MLGSLLIPLSAPTHGYPLLSLPRFFLPLFPAFLALAAFADAGWRDAILVLSSVFLGAAAVAWSVGQWVS